MSEMGENMKGLLEMTASYAEVICFGKNGVRLEIALWFYWQKLAHLSG